MCIGYTRLSHSKANVLVHDYSTNIVKDNIASIAFAVGVYFVVVV